MPVANSYNTLTDENKEARKTNTSDIGDYQSLVLRSVRITILLNHDNVGHRANDFKTSPPTSLEIVKPRYLALRYRISWKFDMVQEERPNKFILQENARC